MRTRSTIAILALVLVTALLVAPTSVLADGDDEDDAEQCPPDHPLYPLCLEGIRPPLPPVPGPDPDPDPEPGDPVPDPVDPNAPYWEPVTDTYYDDDDPDEPIECWRIIAYEGNHTGMTADEATEAGRELYEEDHDPPLPVCPDDPGDDAYEWWVATPLPDMTLDVPPGYGMTGLPSYLTIELEPLGDADELVEHPDGGYVLIEAEVPNVGQIQLIGEPVFTIDWDDGDPVETDSLGVRYEDRDDPDADEPIAYVYADTGDYDVAVEAEWTGYYTIDSGERQELGSARANDAEFELKVEQIQSIRQR